MPLAVQPEPASERHGADSHRASDGVTVTVTTFFVNQPELLTPSAYSVTGSALEAAAVSPCSPMLRPSRDTGTAAPLALAAA